MFQGDSERTGVQEIEITKMEHDTLARALSAIRNAGVSGKASLEITPSSKLILKVLELLKADGYVKDFVLHDNKRGGAIKVSLGGGINNIGVIKPRYPVQLSDFEKFEQSYLPAKDFGRIIISTPKGVMTHLEAKQKKLGGALIAYVY